MTFYSYGLNEERASSVNHPLTLTASQAEATGFAEQLGLRHLTFNATDTQAAGLFGRSVGKILARALTQSTTLSRTTFHLNATVLGATSAQVGHFARTYFGKLALSDTTGGLVQAFGLVLGRPLHAVVAARQTNAARLTRSQGRNYSVGQGFNPFTGDFGPAFGSAGFGGALQPQSSRVGLVQSGSHGSASSTTTPQTAHTSRTANLVRNVLAAASVLLLKGSGRPYATISASVAARALTPGKLLKAASAEALAIARSIPQRVAATTAAAARISFGGGNLYARVFSAVSVESTLLARGIAALRSSTSANIAGLTKTPGKLMGSVGAASLSTLYKVAIRSLNAVSASAAGLVRQVGVLRAVVANSVVFAQVQVSRLATAVHALQTQVVAAFEQHARPAVLSALQTQAASAVRNATRAILVALSAAQTQVAAVSRFTAKALATASAEAAALVRAALLQRLFAVGSSNAAGLARTTGKFVAAVLANLAGTRASYARNFLAASAQLAKLVLHRGSFLGALSPQALALQKAMAKLIGLAIVQAARLQNFNSKSLAVMSPEAVAATRGLYRALVVSAAEIASLVARRGSRFSGAVIGNAASLQRATAKLLAALASQAVAVGRVNFKLLTAASPNVAAIFRPRGVFVHAAQTQAALVVRWFHLFVADWVRQQTILLPPNGGQAEPPAFGPIDPSDQTTFAFNWAARADLNDPIVSASVVSVPPGLVFSPSPVFVSGTLVQVTILPSPQAFLPTVYRLRCTCVFASGRRSSFSIPVPVRTL